MKVLFDIIHEDRDLLVLNKPAGLVCHPTKGDEYSSLISRIRLHLGPSTHPHLINRLDRETSGVMLVGKTDELARALRKRMEARLIHKTYLAIVSGFMPSREGCLQFPLGRSRDSEVAIKDEVRSDGSPSETRYKVISQFENDEKPYSFLEINPTTGRKHQIRIHLAHVGHPIVGDKLYGPDERIYLDFVEGKMTKGQEEAMILPFQALHAWKIGWEEDFLKDRGLKNVIYSGGPEGWFLRFLDETSKNHLKKEK